MNRNTGNRIKHTYQLNTDDDPTEEELQSFFAALKRIASLGHLTPEEHEFVDSLIEYFGIDRQLAEKAFELALDSSTSDSHLMEAVHTEGLKHALLREAYRMAMLDGTVDKWESGFLGMLETHSKLCNDQVRETLDQVSEEFQLLGVFARTVRRIQNWDGSSS